MDQKKTPHRTPPHDTSAEKSLLAAILLDPDVIGEVIGFLGVEDFYHPEHQIVWGAILDLYEARQNIDLTTLGNALKKSIQKGSVDKNYLKELFDLAPRGSFAENYALIVKGHNSRRRLISSAGKIIESALDTDTNIESVLSEAEVEIFKISQSSTRKSYVSLQEASLRFTKKFEDALKRGDKVTGITTGLVDLDKLLSGMHEGNLVILAARPGVGKTALSLHIATHVAKTHGAVGFFSLEMSEDELMGRMVASEADVDSIRFKNPRLTTKAEQQQIEEAVGILSLLPMYIDDTGGLPLMELRSKARKLKAEHDVKLIIVDYLQLLQPGRKYDNKVHEVTFISQTLKKIAKEINIPLIALSQLSRDIEKRGDPRPQLSDLRESGSIEQDADAVIFIYQERADNDLLADPTYRKLKISLAKHRNGPTGELEAMFKSYRQKFFGVEKGLG